MLNSLDILPEDPTELREVSELLVSEVKALSLKVEQLQYQLHGHNRHRFGSKSESLDQLNLTFVEDEEISKAAADQTKPTTEPFSSLWIYHRNPCRRTPRMATQFQTLRKRQARQWRAGPRRCHENLQRISIARLQVARRRQGVAYTDDHRDRGRLLL